MRCRACNSKLIDEDEIESGLCWYCMLSISELINEEGGRD